MTYSLFEFTEPILHYFIWGLLQMDGSWQSQQLFDVDVTITSFGQDDAGEVYLVSDNGGIYRLARP